MKRVGHVQEAGVARLAVVIVGAAACICVIGLYGCTGQPLMDPFSASPMALDGVLRAVQTDIVNMGPLTAGQVLQIEAQGNGIENVVVLREDEITPESGVIVGGGRAGSAFQYRIPSDGTYAIFLQLDPRVNAARQNVRLGASFGDANFRPPSQQLVQVLFAPDFLTGPGLFDPETMTEADRQVLADLSEPVQTAILTELHRVFDPTPVRILSASDALPAGPISKLTFRPDRVLAEDQVSIDAALPPPDPTRPQCQVTVIFGEVLPHGSEQDTGNQVADDEAAVYVGSFQGRGEPCHTSALNSVNNLVFALSQSGAHEIGHLVGLYHVEQIDIMNRTATLAFLRELSLARGQIQIDQLSAGSVVTQVVTNVVQDPEVYFRSAFDVGR